MNFFFPFGGIYKIELKARNASLLEIPNIKARIYKIELKVRAQPALIARDVHRSRIYKIELKVYVSGVMYALPGFWESIR